MESIIGDNRIYYRHYNNLQSALQDLPVVVVDLLVVVDKLPVVENRPMSTRIGVKNHCHHDVPASGVKNHRHHDVPGVKNHCHHDVPGVNHWYVPGGKNRWDVPSSFFQNEQ